MIANRRIATSVAGAFGLVALVTACTIPAQPTTNPPDTAGDPFAQLEPVELTFNHTNPPGGHFEAAASAFTDYIEEATGGKVTFETFYSGSLLPASETFSGVGAGLADVSYTSTIGFESQFPIMDWLSPAMSSESASFPLGDLTNYAAANEFIAREPAVRAEFESLNVEPLWFVSASPGDMLCTEPIVGLAGASGRLTRSPSARLTAEVEALGMTPVSMPFADLYEGLQRDAINCVYTTAGNTTFKPYGLTEVADNYLPLGGWVPIAAAGYIVNLDLWNGFSADLQRVFREASLEALNVHTRGAFEVIADFGSSAEADGVAFLETEDLREVIEALHDELNDGLVGDAPRGVADPESLVDRLSEYRAKWRTLIAERVTPDASQDALDGEELRRAFAAASDEIDWEAFESLVREQSVAE